jgi:hypothetical protein
LAVRVTMHSLCSSVPFVFVSAAAANLIGFRVQRQLPALGFQIAGTIKLCTQTGSP